MKASDEVFKLENLKWFGKTEIKTPQYVIMMLKIVTRRQFFSQKGECGTAMTVA